MKKPVFRGLLPRKIQTGASQSREILDIALIQRTKKGADPTVYCMCACAGWYETLLFAYGIKRFCHDVAQLKARANWEMSHSMTKPTKWHVCPVKTQTSLGICPVWSVFAICMKKHWVLSYPKSEQGKLIRLGRCPGWSESSLGTQVILLVLSCAGSNHNTIRTMLVNMYA